jgi:hypothetical protein
MSRRENSNLAWFSIVLIGTMAAGLAIIGLDTFVLEAGLDTPTWRGNVTSAGWGCIGVAAGLALSKTI